MASSASSVESFVPRSSPRRTTAQETSVIEAYEAFSRGVLNSSAETFESLDRAVWLFERAIALDPSYARAHVELGAAYGTQADYLSLPELRVRAIATLRRATRAAIRGPGARGASSGALQVAMGQEADGMASLRRALAIDPEDAERLRRDGSCALHRLGALRRGRRVVQTRARAEPERRLVRTAARALRGAPPQLQARAKRPSSGRVKLQEAFLSGREGLFIAGAYMRAGHLAALQGRHAEAVDYFRREFDFLGNTDHPLKNRILVELNARLGASYQHLGDAHKALAMFTVALEVFDRRVRLGADDPFTRYYAAGVHAMRGDAEPALAFLERALAQQRPFTAARARIEPEFETLAKRSAVSATRRSPQRRGSLIGSLRSVGRPDQTGLRRRNRASSAVMSGGSGASNANAPSVEWMAEHQPLRVQGLPFERDLSQRVRAVDVAPFADQRVAAQPRLQANLVTAPGSQPHLEQGGIAKRSRACDSRRSLPGPPDRAGASPSESAPSHPRPGGRARCRRQVPGGRRPPPSTRAQARGA